VKTRDGRLAIYVLNDTRVRVRQDFYLMKIVALESLARLNDINYGINVIKMGQCLGCAVYPNYFEA
jgi:hypothetical protein